MQDEERGPVSGTKKRRLRVIQGGRSGGRSEGECLRCRKDVGKLPLSGWCWSCTSDVERARIKNHQLVMEYLIVKFAQSES